MNTLLKRYSERQTERMELAGEGRMLVREWLWKKSLLLQLSGEVFIAFHPDQLLGAGERGGMFCSNLSEFCVLSCEIL